MSACPLCGKDCNFQSSSAGDRVHCTQCGAPLLVTEDGLQVEDDSYQGLQSANLDRTAVLQVKKPELPDFTAEGYRVFEKIGEGAMGTVYTAEQVSLERPVAIKTLKASFASDPEALERFVSEAKVLARINHENILLVHDVVVRDDLAFMCLELIDGESLSEVLRREQKLEVEPAINYLGQAARGLAAAHEEGIVHRDIKPGNLMLTRKDVIKIADFGLAQSVAAEAGVTSSGVILGTPLYMSPEQAAGEAANTQSDIYCLGATLFHLLAGQPPFTGQNIGMVLQQHIEKPPPDLREINSEVPDSLAEIITQMLAKSPAERFADANELMEIIETLNNEAGPAAAPAPSASPTLTEQPTPGTDLTAEPSEDDDEEIDLATVSGQDIEEEDDIFDMLEREVTTVQKRTGPVADPTALEPAPPEPEPQAESELEAVEEEKEREHSQALETISEERAEPEEEAKPEREPDQLPLDPKTLKTVPVEIRPTHCPDCGAAIQSHILYCTTCGEYIPSREDLKETSVLVWKKLLIKGLLDPISGKGPQHLLTLSGIGGLVFAAVVLGVNFAGRSIGNPAGLILVRSAMAALMICLTSLVLGYFIQRLRVVLAGYEMMVTAAPDQPFAILGRGLVFLLQAAILGFLPLLVISLICSPSGTLVMLMNFPSIDVFLHLFKPVASERTFPLRLLGTVAQSLVFSVVALGYPIALVSLIDKPLPDTLKPGRWLRPGVIASLEYLPVLAVGAFLFLIAFPFVVFLFGIFPGGLASRVLGPDGIRLNAGIISLIIFATLMFAVVQYCLWAMAGILGRAWRRRQQHFNLTEESKIVPDKQQARLFFSALACMALVSLISFNILFPIARWPLGAQALNHLMTGTQLETPDNESGKESPKTSTSEDETPEFDD